MFQDVPISVAFYPSHMATNAWNAGTLSMRTECQADAPVRDSSSATNCSSISLVIEAMGSGAVSLSSPFGIYVLSCCQLAEDPCCKQCAAHQ